MQIVMHEPPIASVYADLNQYRPSRKGPRTVPQLPAEADEHRGFAEGCEGMRGPVVMQGVMQDPADRDANVMHPTGGPHDG